jgi:GcrA cell cycle regulator
MKAVQRLDLPARPAPKSERPKTWSAERIRQHRRNKLDGFRSESERRYLESLAPKPEPEPAKPPAKPRRAAPKPAKAKPKLPRRAPPRRVSTIFTRAAVACCWPIGEPGDVNFRFCDDATIAAKPYCVEHAKLAYVKLVPPPAKPAAEAAAYGGD